MLLACSGCLGNGDPYLGIYHIDSMDDHGFRIYFSSHGCVRTGFPSNFQDRDQGFLIGLSKIDLSYYYVGGIQ